MDERAEELDYAARPVHSDSAHVAGVPLCPGLPCATSMNTLNEALLVFRYAPGYPRHSLPEGFFLQVFLSSQALILSFFGYWSGATEIALCMVFMYITYRQLFGYGWWGTLWRFTVVTLMLGAVIVIALSIMLLFFGNEEESRFDTDGVEGYLYIIVAIVAFMAVLLGVTHLINKHTFRKKNNETIKVNSQTL